jgi:hypothetical protein
MAVTRVFPRRQEDPLIQQLLERARREAAKSSAIGSPAMYTAAAGGGFGPVAGVLTAQVLAGASSGAAIANAKDRLARQDEYATKVSEIQRAIDAGPSEELIPGQITVSPENQIESFRGVPYAPEPVTVGEPTEDRNMLGRVADALTGRERLEQETLSRNPQTALSQALRGAGINEMEYNIFQDQLKQKTSPKFTQIKLGDKLFEVQLDSQGQYIKGSEKEILDAEQQYIKPETYKVTLKNGNTVEVDGRTKTGGKLELNIDGIYKDASILIKNNNIESFERSKPKGTKIVSTTNINQKAKNELIEGNIAPLRKQHFEAISNENRKKALQAINQTSQLLDLFSRTSEQGGDLTGTGTEFINVLRGVAKTLGAEVDEKALTSIQNMGAITREKVIPLAKQLGVNPTDFDFKNLIETAPKAANTPAANMYLIRVLAYYANQQADKIAYLQSLNVRNIDGKPTLTFSTEEGAIQYAQEVEAYDKRLREEDEIFFKKLATDPFNLNP